jgi:hypothetical protein
MSEEFNEKQPRAFPYNYSSGLANPLEAVLSDSNISNEMLARIGVKVNEFCIHSYGHEYEQTREYFGVLDYFTHDAWVRIAVPWQIPGKGLKPSPGLERPILLCSSAPVPEFVVRSLCNDLALELAPYRQTQPAKLPKPL